MIQWYSLHCFLFMTSNFSLVAETIFNRMYRSFESIHMKLVLTIVITHKRHSNTLTALNYSIADFVTFYPSLPLLYSFKITIDDLFCMEWDCFRMPCLGVGIFFTAKIWTFIDGVFVLVTCSHYTTSLAVFIIQHYLYFNLLQYISSN